MDTSYSIVHFFDDETVEAIPSFWMKGKFCAWPKNNLFIKKFIEKKMGVNEKEFKLLKARVLSKGIKTLEHARKLAEEARYRSDFSADESFIDKASNNQYSPTLSNSSMPLFEVDFENEDQHQSHYTKKDKISTSQKKIRWSLSPQEKKSWSSPKKKGWSPSPQKLKLAKTQPITLNSKFSLKSTSREVLKVSSNKQFQFNQNDNEQTPSSALKKNSGIKNPVSRKILFDNKSDDERDILNDDTKNDNLDELFLNKPIGQNTNNGSTKEKGLAIRNTTPNPTETVHNNKNDLLQSQNHLLRHITFLKYELKQILNNQAIILDKFDQMEKYFDQNSLNNNVMNIDNAVDFSDCPLPIDNIYDLQTFEDKISGDQNYKNQLIIELSHMGGKNVKSVVKRLMSKLFSDSLLSEFSYTGKKGKKKFSSLFICSVIFDAIKKQIKFKTTPLNEVEDIIKYILAQSPFNLKRQLKKNTVPNSI
ncbi:unnamed protein product [Aphis gossypii]|uniref:DUF4806 domain-containing protein n=1 Tax=Aphis gossypii TaxID=80765 RepID=A0A9P0J8T2_APHGO|nr:unnamed protein product [Aphis gossypii]